MWLVLLLIAVGVAMFSRIGYLGSPFVNDAGVYAALGKTLYEGGALYTDAWEIKPPAVAVLMAGIWAMVGNHWAVYAITQAVIGLLVPLMLADIARRQVNAARFVPTLIVGLVAFNCSRILLTGFQLETIIACLAVMAAWLAAENLSRRSILLAMLIGIVGALAGSLKPTALSILGAYGLAILLADKASFGRRVALCAAVFVGALLVLGVNVAIVARLNLWTELAAIWKEIGLYGSATPWAQFFSIKTAIILGLISWPLAVMAVWPGRRGEKSLAILLLALFWLLAEAVGVMMQKRAYAYHFLAIVPPTILLACLIGSMRSIIAVLIAIAPLAGISLLTVRQSWNELLRGDGSEKIVAYLRDHTTPTDSIFADPLGEMMVRTNTRPGSRLLMGINLINHDDAPMYWQTTVINDFIARRPRYIVLGNPAMLESRIAGWESQPILIKNTARRAGHRAAWKAIVDFVRENYQLETSIDGRDIYRLKEPPGLPF